MPRSPPLAFGLIRSAIHLRPAKGRDYFFRSRDTGELADVLSIWWGRPVTAATGGRLDRPRPAGPPADGPPGGDRG